MFCPIGSAKKHHTNLNAFLFAKKLIQSLFFIASPGLKQNERTYSINVQRDNETKTKSVAAPQQADRF